MVLLLCIKLLALNSFWTKKQKRDFESSTYILQFQKLMSKQPLWELPKFAGVELGKSLVDTSSSEYVLWTCNERHLSLQVPSVLIAGPGWLGWALSRLLGCRSGWVFAPGGSFQPPWTTTCCNLVSNLRVIGLQPCEIKVEKFFETRLLSATFNVLSQGVAKPKPAGLHLVYLCLS